MNWNDLIAGEFRMNEGASIEAERHQSTEGGEYEPGRLFISSLSFGKVKVIAHNFGIDPDMAHVADPDAPTADRCWVEIAVECDRCGDGYGGLMQEAKQVKLTMDIDTAQTPGGILAGLAVRHDLEAHRRLDAALKAKYAVA